MERLFIEDETKYKEKHLNFSILLDAYNRAEFKGLNSFVEEIRRDAPSGLIGKISKSIEKNKKNLNSVVLNLFVAWRISKRLYIAVPLAKDRYKKSERLGRLFFNREGVSNAIKLLELKGLIEAHKGSFNRETQKGHFTRIIATEKLQEMFSSMIIDLPKIVPEHQPVYLRRANKENINIKAGKHAQNAKPFKKNVDLINEFHSKAKWTLNITEEEFIQEYIIKKMAVPSKKKKKGKNTCKQTTYPPNPLKTKLHRVFNVDFEHGGRFYGIWPQNAPSSLRKHILINDEPTVELDFKAMHPTILYHEAGVECPKDPYQILDYNSEEERRRNRKSMKLLFNMALNARSKEEAFAGYRGKALTLGDKIAAGSRKKEWYTKAYNTMEKYHAPIKQSFGTGDGTRLQRIDSDIAEIVLLKLAEMNIPAIPVHDSFCVQERHEETLRKTMQEASEAVVGITLAVDKK